MKPKKKLFHLLIPKQFRVYCRPGQVPLNLNVTRSLAKVTCASCIEDYNNRTGKKHHPMAVKRVNMMRP
jgi:hypothetical protein